MEDQLPPTVYILGLVPFPSNQSSLVPIYDAGHSLVPALQLAVDHINNSSKVLPNYTLGVIIGDSGCDIESKALISLVRYTLHGSKPIVGIVGPACSPAALAVGSLNRQGRLGYVQITTGTNPLLRNQNNYPITFGIVSSAVVFADTIFKLMEENQWNRVTVFHETAQTYFSSLYQSFLEGYSQRNFSEENLVVSEMTELVISLGETQKRGHRVLIVIASAAPSRGLVCFAYHNDMIFPSHQFIFADKRLSDLVQSEPIIFLEYNCSMEQMKVALNGSILTDYNFNSSAPEDITVSGRTVAEIQAEYSQRVEDYGSEINMNIPEDIYAFPYYDAVWAMAKGLDSSVHLLEDLHRNLLNLPLYWSDASEIISDQVSRVDFPGSSGYVSFNDATGHDVGAVINILQLDNGEAVYLGYFNTTCRCDVTLTITGGTFINDSFDRIFNTLHPALIVISTLITAITLTILITFHVATVYYREKRSVKASAPRLSNLIFVGCYFLIIATIMHISQDSITDAGTAKQLCITNFWFTNIGCTLIFGTLLVKLWRLYCIFVRTFSSKERNLSDLMLFIYVTILCVVDLVLCIVWTSAFPVSVIGVDVSKKPPILVIQNECQYTWFGLLELLYKALMLFAVLCLSIINRHIRQREFKHTVTTNILVCSLASIATFVIPLVAVFRLLQLDVNVTSFAIFVVLISTVLLFQFLLLLPPLLPVLKKRVTCSRSHVVL